NQNTERLEGSKWGKGHKDYFFFFHTVLWAFLPWCLFTYDAYVRRVIALVKSRFAKRAHLELAIPGLITIIFIIISSSGYQLPHYLNILFPAFAILTAANLVEKSQPSQNPKLMRIYLYVQYFVTVVCLIIILVANIWSFPVQSAVTAVLAAAAFGAMIMVVLREPVVLKKLVAMSVLLMVFVNVLLNGNFYPQLVQFQPGYVLSDNETVKNIPQNQVYFYNDHSYCFDFYLGALHPYIDVHGIENELQKGHPVWVYTKQEYLSELTGSGFQIGQTIMAKDYHTTRLKKEFMNPKTRPQTLGMSMLVELTGVGR
ncbi:MAG: hypothetical protein INR69_22315, partial [Mucilaginibacter polytrichastri]|nr:hypothetical protein [Mucilaginibacter polytrichastri]